jgi:DNA-binding NarL/FixJ family response regulator
MEHVITALQLGINGCVSYKLNHPDLLNAVETILQGKYYLCPVTLELLFSHFKKLRGENLNDYQLTHQELIIMRQLSEGKKYEEMGKQLYISENTVRSHIRHLYKKLGVHSKIEMISKFIINNEESRRYM